MMDQSRGMDTNALMQRIRRLATLDTSVFDEVRTDPASTLPAALIAVVSVLLFGLGGWLWWVFSDYDIETGEFLMKSVVMGGVLMLILWGVAVGLTYVMLSQVFRSNVDLQELFRVMGFGLAPLALGLLAFFPEIGFGVSLAAMMLAFGTSVIAAQTATNASAGQVLASVGVGFLVMAVALALFVGDEPYGPGIFVIFEV